MLVNIYCTMRILRGKDADENMSLNQCVQFDSIGVIRVSFNSNFSLHHLLRCRTWLLQFDARGRRVTFAYIE